MAMKSKNGLFEKIRSKHQIYEFSKWEKVVQSIFVFIFKLIRRHLLLHWALCFIFSLCNHVILSLLNQRCSFVDCYNRSIAWTWLFNYFFVKNKREVCMLIWNTTKILMIGFEFDWKFDFALRTWTLNLTIASMRILFLVVISCNCL